MRAAHIFVYAAIPIAMLAQDAPTFSKDVAPVFAKYCSGCHAKAVKMGSLDLETWDGVKTGGNHGTVLVAGKADESRLYRMITGKEKPFMPMDGTNMAAGEIDIVKRWIDAGAKPPAPGEVSAVAPVKVASIAPKGPVKQQIFVLAYSPDGSTIALGGYKEVRLVEAATGKAKGSLTGHAEVVRSLAFSKDGKLLAAAGGLPGRKGEVKVWDVARQAVLKTMEGHADCIYSVAFSPDAQQIATSSYDKLVKLWNVETGKEVKTLKDHIDAVYALTYTPDGKRLVSGAADRTVKIWDVATGQRLYTLGEPADGINTVAISPDGKLVAAAGLDKTIRVWSLGEKSGKLENSAIAHEDAILKIAWSPDGKTLVSSSSDKTIKVFRADDLTELKTIAAQPDWPYAIEFAPDGKTFAAGRYDGSLSIYDSQTYKELTELRRASR
ncbi:MAG TPA: c-type cytochrome domain-containing protein [Bryobacteraceae bacterium]|nr:c-type cytochrome domain-containing protein [Bryobacteraceae bacterium]